MTRTEEIKARLDAANLAESYGYNKPATIDAHALSRFQARALDDVAWLLGSLETKRSAEDAGHLAEVKSTVQSAITKALMPKILTDAINADLLKQNTRLRKALEAIVERSKRVSGEGGSAAIAIKALEASK
jgi:hypothetical protein